MMTPQEITIRFIDPWLKKVALNKYFVFPMLAIAIGYKTAETDNRGAGWGARLWVGRVSDESLFYNGVIFVRVMLPFFIGVHIRWSGRNPSVREFLQCYIGWKLNGAFSAVFRVQSDGSAAAGFTSPNPGQSVGWLDGPK